MCLYDSIRSGNRAQLLLYSTIEKQQATEREQHNIHSDELVEKKAYEPTANNHSLRKDRVASAYVIHRMTCSGVHLIYDI